MGEMIGSFFLCFLYLTQTEEKTKFSKDPSITSLIISCSYVAARIMTGSPNLGKASVLNPAIALGTNIVMTFDENSVGLQYFYIYTFMPLLGGVLAVLFHEFLYKPSQDVIFQKVDDVASEKGDGAALLDN
jgi:glycerol uptake facilitator-like aquaporin